MSARLSTRRFIPLADVRVGPSGRREYPAATAFLMPQREHVKQPMPLRQAREATT